MDVTGEITISAWIKRESGSSEWAGIVSKPYYADRWDIPWIQYKLARCWGIDKLCFEFATNDRDRALLEGNSVILDLLRINVTEMISLLI